VYVFIRRARTFIQHSRINTQHTFFPFQGRLKSACTALHSLSHTHAHAERGRERGREAGRKRERKRERASERERESARARERERGREERENMHSFIQHSCTHTQHSSTHPHTPSILRVTRQDCQSICALAILPCDSRALHCKARAKRAPCNARRALERIGGGFTIPTGKSCPWPAKKPLLSNTIPDCRLGPPKNAPLV
jgi:hypothetical protein